MRKPKTSVERLTFIICFFSVLSVCSISFAETDTEYWNEEAIQGHISDRLSASVETKYRFNDDAKQHYYTSTSMELNYDFLSWLKGGLGYREVFKQKKNGWQQENRPSLQVSVKGKTGGWKVRNRLKIERRKKDTEDAYYRFRNKLTLKSPWKWSSAEINPYLADEIFSEKKKQEGFNENRLYAGVDMKLTERADLSLYYMYNIEKKNREWGGDRINVIGTELTFSF